MTRLVGDPEDTDIGRMYALFERQGFVSTSVDDLRDAADVSLRTLYRRYGSREQMIVEVLRYRAEAYLAHLDGSTGVHDLFDRLARWVDRPMPRGCLFLRARADHPEHPTIEQAIVGYHTGMRARLAEAAHRDGVDDTVDELFILHEGLIAATPVIGVAEALASTRPALDRLVGSTASERSTR